MIDCDQAVKMRRWSDMQYCKWLSLPLLNEPAMNDFPSRFSSMLSELLDDLGELWLLAVLSSHAATAKVMLFPVQFINRNIAAKQPRKLCSVFNNRLTLNKPN